MNNTIRSTLRTAAALLVGVVFLRGGRLENRALATDVYQATESTRQMTRTVAGHKLCYLLQTPAGERPKDGWPLLLFLPGYGECGEDVENVKTHGPPKCVGQALRA